MDGEHIWAYLKRQTGINLNASTEANNTSTIQGIEGWKFFPKLGMFGKRFERAELQSCWGDIEAFIAEISSKPLTKMPAQHDIC